MNEFPVSNDAMQGPYTTMEYNLHNGTFLSDISDSVCTEMLERQERNSDLIESPPAFMMNDRGPPSVIYNGVIGNSMSFHTTKTTYSADATMAGTVMNLTHEAANAKDMSVNLSVIDESDEAGIEVDYEQISFSSSPVGRERVDESVLKENATEGVRKEDVASTKSNAMPNETISDTKGETSIPPSISADDNSRKSKASATDDTAIKTSKGSRSGRRRSKTLRAGSMSSFFKRGFDGENPNIPEIKRRGFIVSEQIVTGISTEFFRKMKPEGEVELLFLEQGSDSNTKLSDEKLDSIVTREHSKEDAFELTYLEEDKPSDTLEYGFEVTQATQATCFVAAVVEAPTPSTEDANERVERNSENSNGHSHEELMACKNKASSETKSKTANEWGAKPILSLSLEHEDDAAEISHALSFITMDTKDLTDVSDNSFINDNKGEVAAPAPEPKKSPPGLFVKLFACGALGCGEINEGENENNNAESRMPEEEKIEKLTSDYNASIERHDKDSERDMSQNKQNPTDNIILKPMIKSTIVAKTKVCPGFEVSENKYGKSKESSNSKSQAIKSILKMLKNKDAAKSKKNSNKKKEKDLSRSERHNNKKSILERVNIIVL